MKNCTDEHNIPVVEENWGEAAHKLLAGPS
jgi:hypothetical protein